MDNSKTVKKYIIYFVPIILLHMIFSLTDKIIVINKNNLDFRLSIIHMSIYFYFFVVPIYLMIVNIAFNAKKQIEEYYRDTKLGALSIIAGNIVVLIINIVSIYTIKLHEMNVIIEFFIILVPELIMFFMIEFLGSFLVIKQDEDFEEETLEGLKIPKREIEFYPKNEINDEYKSNSNEAFEKTSVVKEENKSIDKEYEQLTEEKENIQGENDNKGKASDIDDEKLTEEVFNSINNVIEKLDEQETEN